jgi:hypothetical protein
MSREKLLASADGPAVTERTMLSPAVRNGLVVLGLVAVFLTFGLPRWLAGDNAQVATRSDSSFAALCRDHGGTPVFPSGAGTTNGEPFCTIRYGKRVYRMDAITPAGFDDDTARFQRQGCELANQRDAGSTASGQRRWTFVYHPRTGVCERRPA